MTESQPITRRAKLSVMKINYLTVNEVNLLLHFTMCLFLSLLNERNKREIKIESGLQVEKQCISPEYRQEPD